MTPIFRISEDTFYTYQRQFPEFAAAIETGRLAVSADETEGCLVDMALGRCFSTTVRSSTSGRETKTIRQLVPNLKTLIRWLERNKQYAGGGDVRTSEPVKINIAVNSKYDESFLEDVERHAAEGYTDLQIARRLGIALSSFYNYKKQFPEFAAALDSGRMECYGRLRGQLLALALGKCAVTTETCRDGDFRKSTERQLPPNLKAIKYWLADGCPPVASGFCNRMGETTYAQRHSKVSELDGTEWLGCSAVRAGRGSEPLSQSESATPEHSSAQGHSKVSESGGCPSGNAGRMAGGCPSVYADRMAGGCPSVYAGRMAGGCPSVYAGRMGKSSAISSQFPARSHDRRFAKMSRKERQRLLKDRQETRNQQ